MLKGTVTVRLWGTTIGHLGYEPGQTKLATFEYAAPFANSGVQIAPLTMPCPARIHRFDGISQRTFRGVPGVFTDSLPDKFGNQLIDLFIAERGLLPEAITTLDRLLYVGQRGLGALEYEPSATLIEDEAPELALDLPMLTEFAAAMTNPGTEKCTLLLNASTRAQAVRLLRIGSSAGGARAKALVADLDDRLLDGTVDHGAKARYYILKFDVAGNADRDGDDPPGMTRVEYLYMNLARDMGINVPATTFVADGKTFHFMVERFDRVVEGSSVRKLHYASWSGLAHAHRDTTGAYAYEQLVQLARQLDLGQGAVTEIFRRSLFNVIGRNQDDHTKNFGFLMDRSGTWQLAPAFDLTYAFDPRGAWTRTHQLRLCGKQDEFTWDDVLTFGKFCNLREAKTKAIVRELVEGFSTFDHRASQLEVPSALRRQIGEHLRLNVLP